MSLSLWLRSDLCKNIVTIQGVKYDVQAEMKEGYEPYQTSDGRTMYRKEVGRGVLSAKESQSEKTDTGTLPKKEKKDPLSSGESTKVDLEGAKKISGTMTDPASQKAPSDTHNQVTQAMTGGSIGMLRTGMRDLSKFRDALAGLSPKEATEVATKMNKPPFDRPVRIHVEPDGKINLNDGRHRLQAAREAGATSILADVSKFDEEGNEQTSQMVVPTGGHQFELKESGEERSLVPKPQKPTAFQLDADAHKDTDPMSHYHAANLADKLGDAKMAHFHRQQARSKADAVEGSTSGGADFPAYHGFMAEDLRAAGYHEDAQYHEDLKVQKRSKKIQEHLDAASKKLVQHREGLADTQLKSANDKTKPGKKIKEEKSAQTVPSTRVSEDHPPQDSPQDYDSQKEQHVRKLDELKNKLDQVKGSKPVKDDSEERRAKDVLDEHKNESKKKIEESKRAIDDHKSATPSDSHIKIARSKLKEHLAKVPNKPKNEKELKSYENKLKSHKNKANAIKAQIATMEKDHVIASQKHEKKLASLIRNHKNLMDSINSKSEKFSNKHKEAKAKAEEKHKAAMDSWAKKQEQSKKEVQDHKANKPQKPPKQEKVEQKEQPKPPSNELEQAQLHEHKNDASEKAQNLEQYINNSTDLAEDDVKHIKMALEKYKEHANLETVPTKEQQAELKAVDKVMQRHLKAAKAPKDDEQAPDSGQAQEASKKDKSNISGSKIMSAYNKGASLGRHHGAAAASPKGAGAMAESMDFASRGVVSMGHYLLKKDQQQQQKPEQGDEMSAVAQKRAKVISQ